VTPETKEEGGGEREEGKEEFGSCDHPLLLMTDPPLLVCVAGDSYLQSLTRIPTLSATVTDSLPAIILTLLPFLARSAFLEIGIIAINLSLLVHRSICVSAPSSLISSPSEQGEASLQLKFCCLF
jgi:hypothetical protein